MKLRNTIRILSVFLIPGILAISCSDMTSDIRELIGTKTHTIQSLSLTIPAPGIEVNTYETTYELWHEVREWAAKNGYSFKNPGNEGSYQWSFQPSKRKYMPVTTITYMDAAVWLNAYSRKSGLSPAFYTDSSFSTEYRDSNQAMAELYMNADSNGYRLPTVSEWKMVAKAGTKFKYAGSNNCDDVAVYGQSKTNECGTKLPNSWGIFDMSGNVWELCYLSTTNVTAKGGSYGANDYALAIDYTPYPMTFNTAVDYIGFRIFRTVH